MPSRSILSSNGAIRTNFREFRRARRYRRLSRKAQQLRGRSEATFIAVTGSSAKSSTTLLLAHVLSGHALTQCVAKKNTQFPVVKGVVKTKPATKFSLFEVGAGGTTSVEGMAGDIQPDVAIVTMVGLEHYGVFRSREAIAEEKGHLVAAVVPGGFALLNADDPHVMAMRERTGERIVTFGRDEAADYRIVSATQKFPGPLTIEIEHAGGRDRIVSQLVGEHYSLSVAIAFAAATELGVPAAVIAERVASFKPVSTRSEPYPIEGGPIFVLDTIKAPWESLPLAFDITKTAIAPHRRIVLGHISDYAGSSNPKYRDAYRMARDASDEVMFVGEKSHRSTASTEDIESGRYHAMASVKAVYEHIRDTAIKDEVILLKGGRRMHLERVAIAFDHDVKCWDDGCGKKESCWTCGLYSVPYELHRGKRRGRLAQTWRAAKRFLRKGRSR